MREVGDAIDALPDDRADLAHELLEAGDASERETRLRVNPPALFSILIDLHP